MSITPNDIADWDKIVRMQSHYTACWYRAFQENPDIFQGIMNYRERRDLSVFRYLSGEVIDIVNQEHKRIHERYSVKTLGGTLRTLFQHFFKACLLSLMINPSSPEGRICAAFLNRYDTRTYNLDEYLGWGMCAQMNDSILVSDIIMLTPSFHNDLTGPVIWKGHLLAEKRDTAHTEELLFAAIHKIFAAIMLMKKLFKLCRLRQMDPAVIEKHLIREIENILYENSNIKQGPEFIESFDLDELLNRTAKRVEKARSSDIADQWAYEYWLDVLGDNIAGKLALSFYRDHSDTGYCRRLAASLAQAVQDHLALALASNPEGTLEWYCCEMLQGFFRALMIQSNMAEPAFKEIIVRHILGHQEVLGTENKDPLFDICFWDDSNYIAFASSFCFQLTKEEKNGVYKVQIQPHLAFQPREEETPPLFEALHRIYAAIVMVEKLEQECKSRNLNLEEQGDKILATLKAMKAKDPDCLLRPDYIEDVDIPGFVEDLGQ